MLRFLSPARHLSAPRYNFIFHIMLPDSAAGSVHSLVPGLCDLSVPLKRHATSALQSSQIRRPWPVPGSDSTRTFSMRLHPPAQRSGEIKKTLSITRVALGKGKTSLAPPGLLTLSIRYLCPEIRGRSKSRVSNPCFAKQGLFPRPTLSKRSAEKGDMFEGQPHKRLSTYLSVSTPVSR